MELFTTSIGDVDVAVMAVSTHGDDGGLYEETSSSSGSQALKRVDDLLEGMRPVLRGIARQAADILNTDIAPDELSMTLGLGYSLEAGMWVLGGKSEMTFEVEMTWRRDRGQ